MSHKHKKQKRNRQNKHHRADRNQFHSGVQKTATQSQDSRVFSTKKNNKHLHKLSKQKKSLLVAAVLPSQKDGPRHEFQFQPPVSDEIKADGLTTAGREELNPLFEERQRLPIWQHRRELIGCLRQHRSLVLISSTGSGKSTQLPQFLMEGIAGSRVAVTQPRRIAAISLARRVALEAGNGPPGPLVGYKVRFEECVGPGTVVTFLTDGMLLREALLDAQLSRYTHIVLDEAHERSLATDLLFGVVKLALARRPNDLRLVVMSATLDPEPFCRFFPGSKLVYLTGRQYPIELMSVERPVQDYLSSALVTVLQLHRSRPLVPPHDILVFLTGEDDIAELRHLLRQAAEHLRDSSLVPLPLYAALPSSLQLKALAPIGQEGAFASGTPVRKVILATNLAESSLTIPGVRCVVDCGFAKVRTASTSGWVERLSVERISQAQAWQRAGRAARLGPGSCHRLYTTRELLEDMPEQPVPELLRASLGTALLSLLGIGARDPARFPLLDPLPADKVRHGLEALRRLGATTDTAVASGGGGCWELTPLGRDMLALPLEPRMARVVLAAADPRLGCLSEVLKIVAMLSVDHLFYVPANRREAAQSAWQPFESSHGDLFFLLNLFNSFLGISDHAERARWLKRHFISLKAFATCLQVRQQLRAQCRALGLQTRSCQGRADPVIEAFLAGFRHSTAALVKDSGRGGGGSQRYRYVCHSLPQRAASIHPASCLFSARPPAVMFLECVETTRALLRHVTAIRPELVHRGGD